MYKVNETSRQEQKRERSRLANDARLRASMFANRFNINRGLTVFSRKFMDLSKYLADGSLKEKGEK